jgi:hypothetical protein
VLHIGYQPINWLSLRQIDIKTVSDMKIISTRDFRANQTKFLEMANNGEDIVLKSRRQGSFKLQPIKSDASMNKAEFYAKIDRSIKQAEEGKVVRQQDGEAVEDFIDRLLCTD